MITIGCVIICKNESALLSRCLDSLKGIDEIVICDTGSEDNTVEIAKKYTNNVQFRQWDDNFSKARNYVKSFAKSDWLISIDCDEFLHDVGKLREAVEAADSKGLLAVNVNMISEDQNKQVFVFPRVFKNDPKVWWEGAIHNHLSVIGADMGDVWITYGYSPAHHLDKDRAYRILKKEVEATGNGREMFYLGREHFYRGEFEDCLRVLGQYVQKSKFLSEKAEAFLVMGRTYWELKMADDARDAVAQALIINANFKEALLFMGEMSFENNARQWRKLAETASNEGVLFVRNV